MFQTSQQNGPYVTSPFGQLSGLSLRAGQPLTPPFPPPRTYRHKPFVRPRGFSTNMDAQASSPHDRDSPGMPNDQCSA